MSLRASGTIEYSKDKGMNRNYVSSIPAGSGDEQITDVRILLDDEVAAPSHSVEGKFIYPSKVFTGNTTWTVPAGVTSVDVFAVGGGGGGAGDCYYSG
ncbi:hypothetical protein FACS1894176_06230 [Bacteroidia bacterium]|nr:hypothetical protein FACS1894176_06230 [Bacteroidia bacterium]